MSARSVTSREPVIKRLLDDGTWQELDTADVILDDIKVWDNDSWNMVCRYAYINKILALLCPYIGLASLITPTLSIEEKESNHVYQPSAMECTSIPKIYISRKILAIFFF